jgi:hypothetical protein
MLVDKFCNINDEDMKVWRRWENTFIQEMGTRSGADVFNPSNNLFLLILSHHGGNVDYQYSESLEVD